ncbi:two-component system response regulator [Aneurinibacillus sp. Ricciae_BoGa-3]|uniref:response regulator n=1 Tax=Aneurinibacillus sp. Ricciae_BoGa-3 TaxID=3022697 RepID=UPI00233F86BC|nr:two-component system response regulator [Aneurinibacillus sp. Ricciae_BoGa-3]WCK55013.1 two-component system response regulator [Aneurinibacillus sp. Ricciae_BoGa-3]
MRLEITASGSLLMKPDIEKSTILLVDDELFNLDILDQLLSAQHYNTYTALSGREALKIIEENDIDLVLLDIMMPDMNGYEVLRKIKSRTDRFIPVIMVTALDSRDDRLLALEYGSDDFLTKPIDRVELFARVKTLLQTRHFYKQLVSANQRLEVEVKKRTAELEKAFKNLKNLNATLARSSRKIVQHLSSAAEFKDPETAAHIQRISHYTGVLARAYGLHPAEVDLLVDASPMHDIGKIGVPDHILLKPGKLTAEEFEIMKEHTTIGYKILSDTEFPLLRLASEIALTHHEKYDGTGYPNGMSGRDIPLSGRIVAVVDVFDALTSSRPYKEPFSNETAYSIIRKGSGTHFDPNMVNLFFDVLPEIESIQKTYQDREG